MTDRKLATFRTIAEIRPIEGADAIECVVVDGWSVVAKKGEFSVGDLVIYFEIDSVLPIREEFEFLRKGCYVKKDWLISETNPTGEGFRLKTIKLRGQVSQGLVVPINTFLFKAFPEEGQCVDGVLGVVKWDPPVPAHLSGIAKGNFPSFIPKTDQERIQNITDKNFKPGVFETTVKLDGSSMTVYVKDGYVGVCSRNLELDIENDPDTTFAKIVRDMDLVRILKAGNTGLDGEVINIALQGELMGPGIQGNRENLKDHEFYVYDIYDIDYQQYHESKSRQEYIKNIAEIQKHLGVKQIKHVPVLTDTMIHSLAIDAILEFARGPSINNPIREGLVFKSYDDPGFSFKAISNEFLLRHGE